MLREIILHEAKIGERELLMHVATGRQEGASRSGSSASFCKQLLHTSHAHAHSSLRIVGRRVALQKMRKLNAHLYSTRTNISLWIYNIHCK